MVAAELKERWDSSLTLSWGISSECSRRYLSAPCSAPLAVGRYCFARIKTLFNKIISQPNFLSCHCSTFLSKRQESAPASGASTGTQGQPEIMYKNIMHRDLRSFVVQRSCMRFYGSTAQSGKRRLRLTDTIARCCLIRVFNKTLKSVLFGRRIAATAAKKRSQYISYRRPGGLP